MLTAKEHPAYAQLLSAMKRVAARAHPWSGTIYRSAPPRWSAAPKMLTGIGSMMSGARFNAPNTFPAVYGSTTPELAMIESLAYRRVARLPVESALPLVFKAISVEVERLLDLTDVAVLTDLAIFADQLRTKEWWVARARGEESFTQAVGRAAHAYAIHAIWTVSAHTAAHGHNVVVLPDHIRSPSRLKVVRRSVK